MKNNRSWLIVLLSLLAALSALTAAYATSAPDKEIPQDRKVLESRVQLLLKGGNVSLRRDVHLLYALADNYVKEGRLQDARALYEAALQADGWNLERQLAYARLLKDAGDAEGAREKAQFVRDYAEEEPLIAAAGEMLGAVPAPQSGSGAPQSADLNADIVIVPIGKINRQLLDEAIPLMEQKTGMRYAVSPDTIDPGAYDRTAAARFLDDFYERLQKITPVALVPAIMSEGGLNPAALGTFAGKKRFVDACLEKTRAPRDVIDKFNLRIQELSQSGQYDADRLLGLIEERFAGKAPAGVKGFLGVSEGDMYEGDSNFLFGCARKGAGVMSYHRFRALFNDEPPDRARLRDRLVKQAVSSTFFVLGIPRCSNPTCIRAYPHNLQEHDQKKAEICSRCKTQLADYKR